MGVTKASNQADPTRTKQEQAVPPLTPLQRVFVAEFMKDMNATAAYRRLGRACRHPAKRAQEMLVRPGVKAAIDAALSAREEAAQISAERLRTELAGIAFGPQNGPVSPSHRLAAIKQLGQMLGVFKAEAATAVPIQINIIGGPPLPTEDLPRD
jgi:hypothetical protein